MAARRSTGLLRHLASIAAPGGNAAGTSQAFTDLTPAAAAGFSRLVSCAEFQGGSGSGSGGGGGGGGSLSWGARGISFGFGSGPADGGEGLQDDESSFRDDSAPAAASGEPGGLDVESITDAISAAEVDALAAAGEAAWLPTRALINSLGWVQDAIGSGW